MPNWTRRLFITRLAILAWAGPIVAACRSEALPEAPSVATSEVDLGGDSDSLTGAASLPTDTVAAGVDETQVTRLEPTPACVDADDETPAQTEGPFFTPNSPERGSLLESGITGTTLIVTGRVLDTRCRPVAHALVDFWHADDQGFYDNAGYRLRGHQFTNAAGGYRLETILPGVYGSRTRHIHVKVQSEGGPVLTTQLYFQGEAANARDGIYREDLEVTWTKAPPGFDMAAVFDFVVRT